MTTVEEAVRLIRERTPELLPTATTLDKCIGRVLRETVIAEHDLPRTDRATMDGYAVRADDEATRWRIGRSASTNDTGVGDLVAGLAVRVATGTALNCSHPVRVIPSENTEPDGDGIRCTVKPRSQHVHRRGSDAKSGDSLLAPGAPVTPGMLALLASLGRTTATVSRPLRIRHFTTGDEIFTPGQPLPAGGVYDSNGPLISGLLTALGETSRVRHLREDYEESLETVRVELNAWRPDLLLISGGSGPGAGDFTEKLLRDLGYDIALSGGVHVRPGKPLIFGTHPDGVAFGLPGNPLSHWAAFHTFVLPALERLRGEKTRVLRIRATLTEDVPDVNDARPTNHPGRLFWEDGQARISLRPWSASGNVRAMADANAMVPVPAGTELLQAGDRVTAHVFPTAMLLF